MNANEILKKHEDANEMHFHEVDRKWIIEAMEEYAALRQPPVSGSFIQDDMLFIPYMGGSNGWQCKMNIAIGLISIRLGGYGLITDAQHPYEVWYPDEDAPSGHQTADDIWSYVRKNCH